MRNIKMETPNVVNLTNCNGMELEVSDYGATIISLKVPDRNRELVNVVVGLDNVVDYLKEPYNKTGLFLGASIGRYAGRISGGLFKIGNKTYPIYHKEGIHLHGGAEGFDKKYWTVENLIQGENPSVTLSYLSKHLEEGYPGNLEVTVTYELTENNQLRITYTATTDQTTYVNLTNHSYFNLDGQGSILAHQLLINSDQIVAVDNNLIPTGEILDSKNTHFDCRIKDMIGSKNFIGFDDTFVLNENYLKASLSSESSGINMNVYSNQPAMVVYTPKVFDELPFKNDANYTKFPAICFETQKFPDGPNIEHFPSTKLKPDEEYCNKTVFKFNLDV